MEKSGYSRKECDFYDLDLLVPTFAEIEKYFKDYQPDVIGLSGVVSTSYSNVKMIAAMARKVAPRAAPAAPRLPSSRRSLRLLSE